MPRARFVTATLAAAVLFLAALIVGAQPERADAQQSNKTTARTKAGVRIDGKRMIACRGAAIPAGWILVDDLRDPSQCDGGNPAAVKLYNVWAVEQYVGRPAGSTLVVCASSPTPEGWSLVDVYRNKDLCGHPEELYALNVKRIRKN